MTFQLRGLSVLNGVLKQTPLVSRWISSSSHPCGEAFFQSSAPFTIPLDSQPSLCCWLNSCFRIYVKVSYNEMTLTAKGSLGEMVGRSPEAISVLSKPLHQTIWFQSHLIEPAPPLLGRFWGRIPTLRCQQQRWHSLLLPLREVTSSTFENDYDPSPRVICCNNLHQPRQDLKDRTRGTEWCPVYLLDR